MSAFLNAVRISNRLLEAHRAAKSVLGEDFNARMEKDQKLIQFMMKQHKCDALPAAMAIVTTFQKEDPYNSGFAQTAVLAAYVEMVEAEGKQQTEEVRTCPV